MTSGSPVLICARGERSHILPGLSPGRSRLPWATLIVMPSPAAGEGRDDRGRGFACAKAVDTATCHDAGTNAIARTLSTAANCAAGRLPAGRPNDARTRRPKPSTLKPNVRAVSVPPLCRKRPLSLKLSPRVVAQQKFFCPSPCATGQGALSHP
jgi:hypothetical protein